MAISSEATTTILTMGIWQDAKSNDGMTVTRIPTVGMRPEQVQFCLQALKKAGMTPHLHKSETLGDVIRLEGADAMNLQAMRHNVLGQNSWKYAQDGHGLSASLATRGLDDSRVQAIHFSLQSEHLHADTSMTANGPTIKLSGTEAERVRSYQQHESQAVAKPAHGALHQLSSFFTSLYEKADHLLHPGHAASVSALPSQSATAGDAPTSGTSGEQLRAMIAKAPWNRHDAFTGDDCPVADLPTKGMTDRQKDGWMAGLRKEGFDPVIFNDGANSAIRLTSTRDLMALKNIRENPESPSIPRSRPVPAAVPGR